MGQVGLPAFVAAIFQVRLRAVPIILFPRAESLVVRFTEEFAIRSHFRLHLRAHSLRQNHSPPTHQETKKEKPDNYLRLCDCTQPTNTIYKFQHELTTKIAIIDLPLYRSTAYIDY